MLFAVTTLVPGLATAALAQSTPTITVTAHSSEVTEGKRTTIFLWRDPVPTSNTDLRISGTFTQDGDYVRSSDLGTVSVDFRGTFGRAEKSPRAANDSVDKPDGSVTFTLNSGSGYTVGSPSSVTVRVIDDDPTVVSLARLGSGPVFSGGKAEFTVTLGRALVAGETIDVPLAVGGTGVTTSDWDLAEKSGAANTGVALRRTGTAAPIVRFDGAGAQTATLEVSAAGHNSRTVSVALGTGDAFDAAGLATNVGGGADPHGSDNSFAMRVNTCVSQQLLDHVDVRIGSAATDRWERIKNALTESANAITISEVREVHDRRQWYGWSLNRLDEVIAALECMSASTPDAPTISVTGGDAITEGDTARFTLTAAPPPTSDITVAVRVKNFNIGLTHDDTLTRTVTIGTSGTATLDITTLNDSNDWPDGTVYVAVQPGIGYQVAPTPNDAVSISVADDELTPDMATLSVSDAKHSEGSRNCVGGYVSCMNFTVTLSRALQPGERVLVFYQTQETAPVSAQGTGQNRDFYHAQGTLKFSPGGPLRQQVQVWLADDNRTEVDERFELTLAYPVGAAITDNTGIGTITD